MSNKKIVTKAEVKDTLDKSSSYYTAPLYGIYFNGKPFRASKKRVYLQEGRAKAELIRWLEKWDTDRNSIKEAVNELIKEGIIEIREI